MAKSGEPFITCAENLKIVVKYSQGKSTSGQTMLLTQPKILLLFLKCTLALMLIAVLCAGYAYFIDSKRPNDDPKKQNHSPLAILFAPITLPALLIFSVSIFIFRILIYGIFLLLCIIALLIVRKPFLFALLHRTVTSIGEKLMKANTFLIRLFSSP
jgi:hypothetical protein